MKIASDDLSRASNSRLFAEEAIAGVPRAIGAHYWYGTREIAKEKRDPVYNASRFDVETHLLKIIKYREMREHLRAASQSEASFTIFSRDKNCANVRHEGAGLYEIYFRYSIIEYTVIASLYLAENPRVFRMLWRMILRRR